MIGIVKKILTSSTRGAPAREKMVFHGLCKRRVNACPLSTVTVLGKNDLAVVLRVHAFTSPDNIKTLETLTLLSSKDMQLSFFQFLREQLATVPPVEYEDLSGKTVVVIGANIGLGFEAAKHFAKMNPDRLILGCRSKERGEAAAASETNSLLSCHFVSISFYTYKDLKKGTGYESAELWIIDLAQISSVVDFAERFEKDGGRIDILLLNAGIGPVPGQQLTADGYEPVSVILSYTV
jgi:hypothetical protein